MNPVGDYNPFNFMVILLFIYAVLIGFIMIIIYNNIHSPKSELVAALSASNGSNSRVCGGGTDNNGKRRNCIPAPTPIKGSSA